MSQTAVAEAREAPGEAELAFDRLYGWSRDDVYAYVASLLHDGPAAEEVTATAFERAYRKRHRFDPSQRRTARLALRDRPQRGARRAPPPRSTGRARRRARRPRRRRGRGGAERSERRLALRAALEQLAPRERELIALKFFAGLDNAEIASVLGISESNAGTRLHRAVTKLREALDGSI